ncbi:MAG: hypothetical protein AAFV07_21665, partial [Bacteroidota bacterium]
TNGGSSWSLVGGGLPSSTPLVSLNGNREMGHNYVVFDYSSGSITINGQTRTRDVYVGVAGNGLYRSTNGGQNWTKIFSVSSNSFIRDLEVVNGLCYFLPEKQRIKLYQNGSISDVALTRTDFKEFEVDPNNNRTLYAATGGFSQFWRMTGTNQATVLLPANNSNNQNRFNVNKFPWKGDADVRSFLSVGDLQVDPF